jgi:hypothetical protein
MEVFCSYCVVDFLRVFIKSFVEGAVGLDVASGLEAAVEGDLPGVWDDDD